MKDFSDLRKLLLAYKLGELSSVDRDHVDEQMVSVQDFSDRLAEAEYDLLDDYRANRLTYAERRRVEKAFSQQELRRRSALAPGLPEPSATPQRVKFRLVLAGAAVSIVAVAAGLFLLLGHLRKPEGASPVARSPGIRNPSLPATPPPASPPGSSESNVQPTNVAVLFLGPAVVRGEASAVLSLGPAIKMAHVQWIVPPSLSAGTFCLSVTKNGSVLKTIEQQGALRNTGGSQVAEFDLPASVFADVPASARFLFVIYRSDKPQPDVGEYPVTVRKR